VPRDVHGFRPGRAGDSAGPRRASPGCREGAFAVTLSKVSKQFFFEKKNQKTFATWQTPPDRTATAVQKFFASFFQKRSLTSSFQ
jgi:hypothetical protein